MSDFRTRRARPDELKPCPFCGSPDIANVSAGHACASNVWHAGDAIFAVNCKKCGASVPNRYRNDLVVAEWNSRAADAAPELVKALRPFAALLQPHHYEDRDAQPIFGINGASFTVGDLRAAVAAIAKATRPPIARS